MPAVRIEAALDASNQMLNVHRQEELWLQDQVISLNKNFPILKETLGVF